MVNDEKEYFIYNGRKSSDFGVWISYFGLLDSPEKKHEVIDVAGRNGALIIEDGSYENVEIEFKNCFTVWDFAKNYSELKNFLYRQKGYQRLEVSWLPDEYRLAAFEGDIEPTVRIWDGFGKFNLAFNCKPQRFLKSGEEPITLLPMKAEGTTTFETPKYMLPTWSYPETVPSDAYTVAITLLDSESTISYKVRFFLDGDPSYVDTTEKTLTAGERVTEINNNAIGWQVIFTKDVDEDLDNVKVRIEGYSAMIEDKSRFEGVLCRRFYITNPTGFKCRPTIEVFGGLFSLQGFAQVDGEWWDVRSNDYSHLTSHVIMDCENEYMYYIEDGVKKNITGYTTISHYDKNDNTLTPSFPVFGEEETLITAYTNATVAQTEGMMIRIYPHWFTI